MGDKGSQDDGQAPPKGGVSKDVCPNPNDVMAALLPPSPNQTGQFGVKIG